MRSVTVLLMAALALPASTEAGPLRERYLARMKEKSQGEVSDPARFVAGATVQTLAYGRDPAQTLDVYAPPAVKGAPVIVMVHGGGWRLGDKTSPGVVENKLKHWLPQGFIVVSVNYRLLPQAGVDLQASDVAAAIAFVQKDAAGWGGDKDKVIVMGHSAGAHLAALLSADPAPVTAAGGAPWQGTVVLDSAALDLVRLMQGKHAKLYDDAFGEDPAYWTRLSPVAQLKSDPVAMLLVCSTKRPDNPCADADVFAQQLTAAGHPTEVIRQPLSHMEINRDLGLSGDYTAIVDAFIADCLK